MNIRDRSVATKNCGYTSLSDEEMGYADSRRPILKCLALFG